MISDLLLGTSDSTVVGIAIDTDDSEGVHTATDNKEHHNQHYDKPIRESTFIVYRKDLQQVTYLSAPITTLLKIAMAQRILLASAALIVSTQSFHVPTNSRCLMQGIDLKRSTLQMKTSGPHMDILEKMKKSLVPIILGASLLLVDPMNADAARSGGRSGGSSFRGGGGGGSSYRPSRASSSTQLRSSTGYVSQPRFLPMGYGGYGFGGFGFMPYIPVNFNLLLLAGAAYAVITVLGNRTGGSDFSNSEGEGSLGSGATVMKVQIALESDWAETGNIMNTLSMLAEKNAAMSGRGDIAKLLSEASLALLRKKSDWNSAAYESELFRNSGQAAERIDRAGSRCTELVHDRPRAGNPQRASESL